MHGAPTIEPARNVHSLKKSTPNTRNTRDTMGKKGIVGLVNLGNTCYANTIAQCLLHTAPLTMFFVLGKHTDALKKEGDAKLVTMHWAQLLNVAFRDADTEAVSPKNFVRVFSTVSHKLKQQGKLTTAFRVGQQHDAVEFLQFILDMLHASMATKIEITVRGWTNSWSSRTASTRSTTRATATRS